MSKNKFIILLFVLLGFSSQAVDTHRRYLENTSTYRWANNLALVFGLGSLAWSAYDFLKDSDDDSTQESLLTLSTIAKASCSVVGSLCASKICRLLPPLTSHFSTEKTKEKDAFWREAEGLLLWAQDNVARAGTMSVIYFIGEMIPMPMQVQGHPTNMAAWCARYANGTQSAHLEFPMFEAQARAELSINFVLIPPENRTLSPQRYLTGTSDPTQIAKILVNPLMGWTQKCPSCILQLGYDEGLENSTALANTQQFMCDQFSQAKLPLDKLYLLNLRALPEVQKYIHLLDPAKLDVYLIVDILRLEQTLHAANTLSDMAVYTDLDIPPFPIGYRFIAQLRSMLFFKKFWLTSAQRTSYENGFFAFASTSTQPVKNLWLAPAIKVLNARIGDESALPDQDFVYATTILACLSQYLQPPGFVPMLQEINQEFELTPLSASEIQQFITDVNQGSIIHHSAEVISNMVRLLYLYDLSVFEIGGNPICPVVDLPTGIAHQRLNSW